MQDYLAGTIGGLMIGAAAAIYLVVNGRIMGASGILGGLVEGAAQEEQEHLAPERAAHSEAIAPTPQKRRAEETLAWAERLAFVAGLVLVPALMARGMAPQTHVSASPMLLLLAGLLVGAGTRLANGCTSGHGVCGLSRLSLRGFVATALYLLSGGLALALGRHALGAL